MTGLVLLLLAAAPKPPASSVTRPAPAKSATVKTDTVKPADVPTDAAKADPLKGLSAVKALTAPKVPAGAHGETKCAACHATSGWNDVRFNHDRTGFPLLGAHATTGCRDCHVVDFKQALPRACSACHRDVHAGELGARCDGCHDAFTWRSRFDADAHRRTNFPLLGGHAALPCTECHLEARERRFSRAAVECGGCHGPDYQRAAFTGSRLDHAARAFDAQRCRGCHGAFRWGPARWPGHDACFPVNAGPHAAYACLQCHTGVQGSQPAGSCSTGTAACTACHEHQCSTAGGQTETDRQHAGVAGYQCSDRKCYECHQPGVGVPP